MAVEDFSLEQNHFSDSSTAFEESKKDQTPHQVRTSPLHSANIVFDSSTTFQIPNQIAIPSKQDSGYRSIPRSRESLDLVTSLGTLEVKESAETECPLVTDTTYRDLDIVKQLGSVDDDTNIISLTDLSSSPIAIPLIVFPFSETDEDGSSESGYTLVKRDPPCSTSFLPTLGACYQRLVDLQNLYNRSSILDKIISDIHGTPPHREEPNMQSLFTPHYPDEQRILDPGNSETDLKLWDLGFDTRTLALSIRDSPHRTPTLIRYRMVGDHRIFLSYFTREHIHEREKLAWNKISAILSPDLRNAPLSPGFEKLATDFFSGKMVLEDYGDALEPSTGTMRSEKNKNHSITYNCSDISDDDKRRCLHDPAFTIFIQDLVMCNDLENAKNNETTWHGARVLGRLEDKPHLDDINLHLLLDVLELQEKQSSTEKGGSGFQPCSAVILNPPDSTNTGNSDTVVTPGVTMASEFALPQTTQGSQVNGQELKDAKYDDEWMNLKEAATTAKKSKKSSNKRNKNRNNKGSKNSPQVNSTFSRNDEESQNRENPPLKRQIKGHAPKGKGLSQPRLNLETEPEEELQNLQKPGGLTPLDIPKGYGEEGGWRVVQPKSSNKLGRRKKASTRGTIRSIGRLPQRGPPCPLVGNPELSRVITICDGNNDVDSTSVNDYVSETPRTACVECGSGSSEEGVGVDREPSNIPLLSDIGNLARKVDWEEKLTGGLIPASSGAASEGANPIEALSKIATNGSCNRYSANIQDAESRAGLETQDGDEVDNVTYESTVPISSQFSDEAVLAASENDSLSCSGVSAQTIDFVGTDIKLASISAMVSAEAVSAQNFRFVDSTRTDIPNFMCESSESDTEEHGEMNLADSNSDIGVIVTCTFCGECLNPRVETPQILCSGCGVSGEGNYCSVACLLVDAYDHSSHCTGYGAFNQAPFNHFPVYSLYIPNPITSLIGYHETPDRFRQRAFSMYCWSGVFPKLSMAWTKKHGDALPTPRNFDATEETKRTGDYAIFRSELTCPGPRRNPHGDVIFTIKLLVDDPRKQMLNRALNACFLVWEPQIAEFLYRLLKNIILHTESFLLFKYTEPLEVVYVEFKNQFRREFGFHEMMATIHTEFNLWQEWQLVGLLLWKLESCHPILVEWLR